MNKCGVGVGVGAAIAEGAQLKRMKPVECRAGIA